MESGDIIETTKASSQFYGKGDIATLTHNDGVDWWADFRGHDNKKVKGSGIWCVGDNFKLKG